MWRTFPQTRVTPRVCRRYATSLRRAVRRSRLPATHPHCQGIMLCDRVAAARDELLELADLLERAHGPDAGAVEMVRQLLTDGCESPLYNRAVHPSELKATLFYAKKRLADCTDHRQADASGAAHPCSPSRPPGPRAQIATRNQRTRGALPALKRALKHISVRGSIRISQVWDD